MSGKSTAGHVTGSATRRHPSEQHTDRALSPTAGASLCSAASPQHLAACKASDSSAHIVALKPHDCIIYSFMRVYFGRAEK